MNFEGSKTSLWRIVRKLGLRWLKTRDNRRVLTEKSDIRAKKARYLRQISKCREEGRPLIYTDETYIHGGYTMPNSWTDDSLQLDIAPIS